MTDGPRKSPSIPDTPFYRDVMNQPAALDLAIQQYKGTDRSRLNEFGRLAKGRWIAFVGMGSSLYAPYGAALRLDRMGVWAVALDASEVLHYHAGALPPGALPVLVSQSGESVEVIRLAERWRRKPYVAITNNLESTLAEGAALSLPLHAGVESATSSRTFVNTVAVSLLASAAAVGDVDDLLEDLRVATSAIESVLNTAAEQAARLDHLLGFPSFLDVVGRGPALAAAQQSALILREAAGVLGAAHSIGLLRHGPIHDIGSERCALVFSSVGPTAELASGLVEDLLDRSARVAWVTNDVNNQDARGPDRIAPDHLRPNLAIFKLPPLSEDLFPIPAIVAAEFLSCLWAGAQGIVPGERVEKVTRRE